MVTTRSRAAADGGGAVEAADGVFRPWSSSPAAVAKHFGTDLKRGLTSAQVEAQRAAHGFNELVKPPGKPLWKLVLEQFDDMLVKVRAGRWGGRF